MNCLCLVLIGIIWLRTLDLHLMTTRTLFIYKRTSLPLVYLDILRYSSYKLVHWRTTHQKRSWKGKCFKGKQRQICLFLNGMLIGKLVTAVCCRTVSTKVGSYARRLLQTQVSALGADANIKISSNQLATHAGWTAVKGAVVVSRGCFYLTASKLVSNLHWTNCSKDCGTLTRWYIVINIGLHNN